MSQALKLLAPCSRGAALSSSIYVLVVPVEW